MVDWRALALDPPRAFGPPPRLVAGEATNLKVTTQADVTLAEAILASRPAVAARPAAVSGARP